MGRTRERKAQKREVDTVRWFCKYSVEYNPLEIMVVDIKYCEYSSEVVERRYTHEPSPIYTEQE